MPSSNLTVRAGAVAPVLAYLFLGSLYVGAVPPWEAPDEPAHTKYAEMVAAGRLPTQQETYEAHQPPLYYLWPSLAIRLLEIDHVPRAPHNPRYPVLPATWSSIASNVVARGTGVSWQLVHPVLLAREAGYLLWSFWARFGWFSFTYPVAITLAAALAALASARGLAIYARASRLAERRSLFIVAVIGLVLFLAAAKNVLVDPQPQGRLMFPALTAIGFLIAAGWLANAGPGRQAPAVVGLTVSLLAVNIFGTQRLIPAK